MSVLSIPNSFSPNTTIQSSQVNANYSAIATEYNAHAVQTDVAKTITVTHTFSVSQTFSAGMAVTGASTFGTINGQTISASASLTGTLAVAGALTASGTVVLQASYPQAKVTDGANTLEIGTTANEFYLKQTQATQRVLRFRRVDSADAAVINYDTSATTLTLANGLVVSSGGVTVTGNSTITGNLTVTGTISAVQGGNLYVRRTSDLNFTSATDLTLTFAIGATEEWEFEYVLAHTNGSAATASFTVAGPASSTGLFGGFATVNGSGSAVQGSGQIVMGNSLTGMTMNATAGFMHIRGYVKGGGTPGNVTIAGTVSAGTGVLKAGSYVRYSRIA